MCTLYGKCLLASKHKDLHANLKMALAFIKRFRVHKARHKTGINKKDQLLKGFMITKTQMDNIEIN